MSASDASPAAVAVARANAERLACRSTRRGCGGLPDGDYDLVLANLPYVREDEWAGLAPEIRRYEPREALVAGPDGLDAIRALVAGAPAGTRLALEHAPARRRPSARCCDARRDLRDLAGRERVTAGSVP